MEKFTPRYKYGLYTRDWGDARIREEYDIKIENWLNNFPKDKHPLLLELLKNFYFYSQAKVGEKVKQLHQKLVSNHSIDVNKAVFTKIPKKAGVGFSDITFMTYWNNNELYDSHASDIWDLIDEDIVPETLVFVDDFFGSGLTFIENLEPLIEAAPDLQNSDIFFVSIHGSEVGVKAINEFSIKHNMNISIEYLDYSSEAFKDDYIFDAINASLKKKEYIELCEIYGVPSWEHLGFNDVQALVAFEFNAPNDTLGLFRHSAEDFAQLFKRKEKHRTTLSTMRAEANKRKKQRLPCVLFGLEDNQYQRFIAYCLAYGKYFSENQACIDFGITTDTLEKWIAYIVDHKYIVYKDGTIKPGKRTRDNMFTSRLSDWKKNFGLDVVEQKLIASRRADTYIPHNFSSSFSGYKK